MALHRVIYGSTTTFLSEGSVKGTLRLDQLDVHVTSDEFLTALLPSLATRTASLSTLALGDYAAGNADLDFFVARGDDRVAYLAFVSPDDPRPQAAYPYTKPGFFSDDALAANVSVPVVLHSTESSHEAVGLAPASRARFSSRTAPAKSIALPRRSTRAARPSRSRSAGRRVRRRAERAVEYLRDPPRRLVMKGVDLRTVQQLLGHKTLAMTLRYSHLSPAHQLARGRAAGDADCQAIGDATEEKPATVGAEFLICR